MPRREWLLPVIGIALWDARLGESVSIHEKSEKFWLFRYGSAQSGLPMRLNDTSMDGNADQVAKIEKRSARQSPLKDD